jgi:hypothetical protein
MLNVSEVYPPVDHLVSNDGTLPIDRQEVSKKRMKKSKSTASLRTRGP